MLHLTIIVVLTKSLTAKVYTDLGLNKFFCNTLRDIGKKV